MPCEAMAHSTKYIRGIILVYFFEYIFKCPWVRWHLNGRILLHWNILKYNLLNCSATRASKSIDHKSAPEELAQSEGYRTGA